MSAALIVGNLIFGGIGFIGFVYGKRMRRARMMALGGALMAYGYFVTDAWLLFGVGTGLTAALWRARD